MSFYGCLCACVSVCVSVHVYISVYLCASLCRCACVSMSICLFVSTCLSVFTHTLRPYLELRGSHSTPLSWLLLNPYININVGFFNLFSLKVTERTARYQQKLEEKQAENLRAIKEKESQVKHRQRSGSGLLLSTLNP